MRDALIFAGLTLGGVATVFSATGPLPGKSDTPPTKSAAGPAAPAPAPTLPSFAAGATELRRAGDGHFYAPVTIGAQPITMLVDTGASVVALTDEDARLAGIVWDPAKLAVVAQGAGGAVRGVAVNIAMMRLGTHEARDVPAVIIPEGLPISLLGQSFLKDIEPVRIEKDRMVLGG